MIDINALVNAAINSAVQHAIEDTLVPYKATITELNARIVQLEERVLALEEDLTGSGIVHRIERVVEQTVHEAIDKHDFGSMISFAVEQEIDSYDFCEIVADLQDPSAVTETSEFRDAVREVILEAFSR